MGNIDGLANIDVVFLCAIILSNPVQDGINTTVVVTGGDSRKTPQSVPSWLAIVEQRSS
jgi:hypothetical protein